MNHFSFFTIFNIVLIVIGAFLLLSNLYTTYTHGKLIIRIKVNKGLTMFWSVALIVWSLQLWFSVQNYIYNNDSGSINNSLFATCWVELSMFFILKSLRASEIRENGIYNSGYFYNWHKIQSYCWIPPITIEFNASTSFKNSLSFHMPIKKEQKSKIEEVLQRKLSL